MTIVHIHLKKKFLKVLVVFFIVKNIVTLPLKGLNNKLLRIANFLLFFILLYNKHLLLLIILFYFESNPREFYK